MRRASWPTSCRSSARLIFADLCFFESSFDDDQSAVVYVRVGLGDLVPDSGAVFSSITSRECLRSLSSHVSGWMEGLGVAHVCVTKMRKTYFTHSH